MVIGNLANYAIYKVSNGQRHVLPGDLYVLDVVRDLALEAVASNLDPNNDRLCRYACGCFFFFFSINSCRLSLEFRKQVFQDIYTEENSTAVNNLIYVQSIESIKHMPLVIGVDEMVEIAALQLRLHSGDVVPKELRQVTQMIKGLPFNKLCAARSSKALFRRNCIRKQAKPSGKTVASSSTACV